MESKTFNFFIQCSASRLYSYVSNPENFPEWASSFCRSVKQVEGEWIIETPQGDLKLRFVPQNPYGILDHYVQVAPGTDVYVPMRVIPNEKGCEVIFTLFKQPFMDTSKFDEDTRMVEQDLQTLKKVLES